MTQLVPTDIVGNLSVADRVLVLSKNFETVLNRNKWISVIIEAKINDSQAHSGQLSIANNSSKMGNTICYLLFRC